MGNDFGWALRALKNGTPVTRLAWHGDAEAMLNYERRYERSSLSLVEYPFDAKGVQSIAVTRPEGTAAEVATMEWQADTRDLTAEDWVLASDVKAGGA